MNMEEERMSAKVKNKWCSIIVVLIFVGMLVAVPGYVKADIYDVGAGHTFQLSKYVTDGDVITWDWHTTDLSEGLDFWIESPTGARYSYRTDIQSWTGSFTAISTGTWYIKWYNDNLLFKVTVEYDVSSYTPYTGGGDTGGNDDGSDFSIDWIPIILLLMVVIIAIVAIAGVASAAGKKKQTSRVPPPPPTFSQQPQQMQYEQSQPKYYSNCDRSISPDCVMCPYCGHKNLLEYHFCIMCKQPLPEVKE